MQFVYELRPFQQVEAAMVAHWASEPDDLWNLTGQRDIPLTRDQVEAWPLESNFALTLRYLGDLVAFAEIVEDEVEGDAEIVHLVVAPDMRRAGHGTAMLERLCLFLQEARPWPHVWIRVGRDDQVTKRCAESAGFIEQPDVSGPRFVWLKRNLTRTAP